MIANSTLEGPPSKIQKVSALPLTPETALHFPVLRNACRRCREMLTADFITRITCWQQKCTCLQPKQKQTVSTQTVQLDPPPLLVGSSTEACSVDFPDVNTKGKGEQCSEVDNKVKTFACPYCSVCYTSKANQVRHMEKHCHRRPGNQPRFPVVTQGARSCPIPTCAAHNYITQDKLLNLKKQQEVQLCDHIKVLASGRDQCMICNATSATSTSRFRLRHPCFRDVDASTTEAKVKNPKQNQQDVYLMLD